MTQIAFLFYDDMTALDAVGPYEVLARMPGAEVVFVASSPGPKRSDVGLVLSADASFADVPQPDVIVVPGGPGSLRELENTETVEWLRGVHETARWTTSVCTGSLVLGAAGVLQGKRATTHWRRLELLARFGAEPVSERVVVEGDVITAAGVSSGIDMALTLVGREAGDDVARALQLAIEYDPQPPYDSGTPEKAGAAAAKLATELLTAGRG